MRYPASMPIGSRYLATEADEPRRDAAWKPPRFITNGGTKRAPVNRTPSMREICGLRSSEGKLKHLGIAAPSLDLGYANEHRSWRQISS